jgi:rubredoxin
MDLDVHTRRPERERACRACQWSWLEQEGPPDHSCRTPPTTPRATIEAQLRAAERVFADREVEIRKTRLADLRLQRGYR